jgi:hypothetical protein
MSLKVCELLNVGDVQEIQAGRQYIHSLFHLDQPSATIVIRTEKSPLYLPQFAYTNLRSRSTLFRTSDDDAETADRQRAVPGGPSDADRLVTKCSRVAISIRAS